MLYAVKSLRLFEFAESQKRNAFGKRVYSIGLHFFTPA